MTEKTIYIEGPFKSPEGWAITLRKTWNFYEEEILSMKLFKALKRLGDHSPGDWTDGDASRDPRTSGHRIYLGHDRQEADLRKEAYVGAIENLGIDVRDGSGSQPGAGPYRTVGRRDTYAEAKIPKYLGNVPDGEWVLRGGQEVLARHVDSQPKDWQWTTLPKVTYFRKQDVVDYPRGSSFMQNNYIFRQGDTLYGIRPEQLFKDPMKNEGLVRLFIAEALRTGSSSRD